MKTKYTVINKWLPALTFCMLICAIPLPTFACNCSPTMYYCRIAGESMCCPNNYQGPPIPCTK